MLALCLILSATYYAQNYAGIIGWSLLFIAVVNPYSSFFKFIILKLFLLYYTYYASNHLGQTQTVVYYYVNYYIHD